MSIPGANLRGAVDLSALASRPAPGATAGSESPGAGAEAAAIGLVNTGTDANFADFIELSRQVPVLVSLEAKWAEQSAQLAEALTAIVTEQAGAVVLVRVDVEANRQLGEALQVRAVPTTVAIIGGRPLPLFEGLLPDDQLRDVVAQVLSAAAQSGIAGRVAAGEASTEPVPAPLPPLHQAAYDAIERGDYAAAIEAYRTAIAQNPADDEAKAGLAQVSLLHRLQGTTADAVRAAAAADPSDVNAALAVADLDLSGGHVDEAFDRLLTLFPTLDADGKNAVRLRLVDLFEIVGAGDARVIRARGRLANLLY